MLLSVYLLPTPQAQAESDSDFYLFNVFLDGKPIGTQQVNIEQLGQQQQVNINTSLDVKLLFLTVYQYQHENTEVWQQGCIQSIQAVTNDNGTSYQVNGNRTENGLMLETSDQQQELPGCVRTFAYWQPELLSTEKLLNAQTGDYQDVDYIDLGSAVTSLGEKRITARQVRLKTGEDTIDL